MIELEAAGVWVVAWVFFGAASAEAEQTNSHAKSVAFFRKVH